jgi:hypothetical protein
MDNFIVVRYRLPVRLAARRIEHEAVPADQLGLGYFRGDHLVARGIVPPSALEPLEELLRQPVQLAIAATQDDGGNIDGRLCVVLPVPREEAEDEPADEPWKASLPRLPAGIEAGTDDDADGSEPRLVLLPLGHVVRTAANRKHDELADDVRDMLENLLAGKAEDSVARAIDDLLRGI